MARDQAVLVLGVGNTLFTDDGAGVQAVRRAQARWAGSNVEFCEAAAGGLELMDILTGYQAALVVDVALTGQVPPGEIYSLDLESLPALDTGGAHGAHLGTALEVARRMGIPMPRHLEVLALEAADVTSLGEELTPAVAAAIEPAAEAILRLVGSLLVRVGEKR